MASIYGEHGVAMIAEAGAACWLLICAVLIAALLFLFAQAVRVALFIQREQRAHRASELLAARRRRASDNGVAKVGLQEQSSSGPPTLYARRTGVIRAR